MASVRVGLMDLPIEMIDHIFSYLSYDQITKIRPVNRAFNNICSNILNNGFIAFEKFHNKCLKAVKSKLPRRESERKNHPLARHCDILMAVETRFSMLSMTFSKHIEMGHCCFIPGKVLDEGFKLLRIVSNSTSPSPTNFQYSNLPRPYEFLQEYRDISSMAMEHFDDKILPSIRERMRVENPRLYAFKKGISRPQLLGMQAMKVTILQPNSDSAKSTSAAPDVSAHSSGKCPQKIAPNNYQKVLKLLCKFDTKCKKTLKAVTVTHRSAAVETAKLRLENTTLKRKCNQLNSLTTVLRKDLAEMKNTVSALSKELNHLKSEQSSPSESSSSDLATNPALKLYSLLRLTDRKCNSTRRAVVTLNHKMKMVEKKTRSQVLSRKILLKQRSGCNRSPGKQRGMKTNLSRTVTSTNVNPSCSRGQTEAGDFSG